MEHFLLFGEDLSATWVFVITLFLVKGLEELGLIKL